jgi:hypothetical protein
MNVLAKQAGALLGDVFWPVFTTYKWRDLENRIWAGVTLHASHPYISPWVKLSEF